MAGVDAIKKAAGLAEWATTRNDFLMLADLADYHARKVHAAMELLRARVRDEPSRLTRALAWMEAAVLSWRSLAERGRRDPGRG